jgi:hypothetical protein
VAPEAWSWAALGGREAVATAESDKRSRQRPKRTSSRIGQAAESDKHPGLTDRVGPPVSERETTAKMDKRRSWAAAGMENKGGGRAKNKEKRISELKLDF